MGHHHTGDAGMSNWKSIGELVRKIIEDQGKKK